MKKNFKNNKKAQMQMSVGTLVTIVLLMSVLIFGLIFVRNIMCSGIVLTDKINTEVENEIKGMFGTDDYGVRCMGEGSEKANLGDGGSRKVFCVINEQEGADYELNIQIENLDKDTNGIDVQEWVRDQDFGPAFIPVGRETVTTALLDIPDETPQMTLKITTTVTRNGQERTPRLSYVNIEPIGALKSGIC